MNISQATKPGFKMPEYSILVGDLVVREVANSADLIVHAVTTKSGQFVGNINERWSRRVHQFCVVTSDGIRHPLPYGGLVEAAKNLAKKNAEVAS